MIREESTLMEIEIINLALFTQVENESFNIQYVVTWEGVVANHYNKLCKEMDISTVINDIFNLGY